MTSVVLRSTLRRWSPLPLRIIVGYGFIAHGFAKIANGPEQFAASLHALGVPASHAMAWATIAFELIGGLAVLAGAFVPFVSLPWRHLLVAAITVHLPYGFSSIKLRAVTSAGPQFGPPGYEVNLLYLAALATLVLGDRDPSRLTRLWPTSAGRDRGAKPSMPTPSNPSVRSASERGRSHRSVAFYRDRLGLELAQVIPSRQVAFFWIGPPGHTMLGLWAAGSGPQKATMHIAFAASLEDVLAAPEALRQAGIVTRDFDGQPTNEAVVIGWMPAVSVFFHDPDGHLLRYIAMLPDDPRPDVGVVTWRGWTAVVDATGEIR